MEVEESRNLMAKGAAWKKAIFFALLLLLENLFQQLYNTTDSLIVGNFLGSNALAAVSSSRNLIFLMAGPFSGITIGTEIVIARYLRARDVDNMQRVIHAAVTFGLVSSLALMVLGVLLAPQILIQMNIPANILPQSITHFRIYFMDSLGLVMYNISVGVLQTVGDSRHPLDCPIVSSIISIVLDIALIVVFRMGVGSAVLATVLSRFVSTFLCMNRLLRIRDNYRLSLCKTRLHKDMLALIIHYDLPNGLQNSIIATVNAVAQPDINGFREMATTGRGAHSKIKGSTFSPITNFTMALTTSVDQNLGVYQYERTKKGARLSMLCSMAIAKVIGIVIFLEASLLTAAFGNDLQVVMPGAERARTSAMFFFLLAYSHCISIILCGVGKSMVPVIVMLLFWCAVWVTFLTVMIHFLGDIAVVYWVYPPAWFLGSIAFLLYHCKANWVHAFKVV